MDSGNIKLELSIVNLYIFLIQSSVNYGSIAEID